MSHTPRPWIQNGRFVGTASNNDDILNGCHHNEEQALANAKLIAAAPELLQALKDLKSLIETNAVNLNRELTLEFLRRAIVTIAKAEGK